ncbi:MAG: hypothetical protein RBQ88_01070 [Desulfobulbus oligotrophicus]|jgi:hypothetical protein|nr:hypothetical protein [Desulfobulbus oligotrophicus]
MAITVTYTILFEVKILHHYLLNNGLKNFTSMSAAEQAELMLLYDISDIFQITPSVQTQKDLTRHQCIFKQTATGFLVGLKTEKAMDPSQPDIPFHSLDNDLIFTFNIHIKDYNLLNYTALPLTGNTGQVYLFSNLATTPGKLFPSLCSLPGTFSPGRTYMPGDTLIDNPAAPTRLFTAKVKTTAAPTSSSDWLAEQQSNGLPMSYANAHDRYRLVRQRLLYTVTTADLEPDIVVQTATGTTVDVRTDVLPGEFRTIQLDLRGLPEGLYQLRAESADQSYQDQQSFYLLHGQETPFAILQLAVHSNSAAYNMLNPQGHVLNPVYELRLKNRATHWRYIGKSFNASSVTADPMPLTRFGFIDNISVPDSNGVQVDDLPNPEVTMIRAEALTVETENKFYSEIHIH